MLDVQDLSVAADAYCLLCSLVRNFNCDELLFGFAMAQLSNARDTDDWLRLELEAEELLGDAVRDTPQVGGRHQDMVSRIHATIAQAFAATARTREQDANDGDHTKQQFKEAANINVQFCQAFWNEAGHILKWGLLLYLAKRNPTFCDKLVQAGLTETLLMCLVDVAHPVRQAAALAELHRLRALSPEAQSIAKSVLATDELLGALTIEEFMSVAGSDGLARARYTLRNIQAGADFRTTACSAKELDLFNGRFDRQHMGLTGNSNKANPDRSNRSVSFLTEAPRDDGDDGDEVLPRTVRNKHVDVPRSGPGIYNVKRVLGDSSTGYTLDHGDDEVPFCGFLASFSLDPLNVTADEQTPLLEEVRSIERLGARTRRKPETTATTPPARAQSTPKRRGRPKSEERTSHCPSIQHSRALALRPLGPLTVGQNRSAKQRRFCKGSRPLSSVASSKDTDLSMRCGGQSEFFRGSGSLDDSRFLCCSHKGCSHKASKQHSSCCETSAGPDFSNYLSLSEDSISSDRYVEIQQVIQQTPLAAVVEVRHQHVDEPVSGVQKRILHVAGPPYHECIAFESIAMEKARHAHVGEVSRLLHPSTRRRLRNIQAVGKFPRRHLVGSACPLRDQEGFCDSPTSANASGAINVPWTSARTRSAPKSSGSVKVPVTSARMERPLSSPLAIGKLSEKTAPPEATVTRSPRMNAIRR